LSGFVPPDRFVAVHWSRTAEQQHCWSRPGVVGKAQRAGDGQRPGAQGDVMVVERCSVGVGRWLPRSRRFGGAGRGELEGDQPARCVHRHDQGQLSAFARQEDLFYDCPGARPGGFTDWGAHRADRAAGGESGLPAHLQRVDRDQCAQLGREHVAEVCEPAGLRQVDHDATDAGIGLDAGRGWGRGLAFHRVLQMMGIFSHQNGEAAATRHRSADSASRSGHESRAGAGYDAVHQWWTFALYVDLDVIG